MRQWPAERDAAYARARGLGRALVLLALVAAFVAGWVIFL